MERRSLFAGLVVLAISLFALTGTASAHKVKPNGKPAVAEEKGCVVHSLPSFIDQGLETEASSVADIIEVECEVTGKQQYDGKVKISDTQLFNKCKKGMSWSPTNEFNPKAGVATEATLDNDGNATVVLWAGPDCKAGETTITVDELEFPFETYMTTFNVLPPETTEAGVEALDPCAEPVKQGGVVCNSKVEDDIFSSVATIIQVETPVVETKVAIDAEQLFSRCGKAPHVIWVGPNEKKITEGTGRLEEGNAIETDDNGNAFVVALGAKSCQPGKVKIEASLQEVESFDSWFGEFTIEFPRTTLPEH